MRLSLLSSVSLCRSRAIARYIASKAKAGHLVPLPSDDDYLQKLASFETAASIEYSDFEPFAGKIAVEGFFKPSFVGEFLLCIICGLRLVELN